LVSLYLHWVIRAGAATAVLALFTVSSAHGAPAVGQGRTLALRGADDLPIASVVLRHGSDGHHGTTATTNSTQAICDKDIDRAGSIAGVAFVAAQDNGICTTGEAAAYEKGGELYIAQAGGEEAAYTITRIAPNGSPTLVAQEAWPQVNTYTADIKAFKQGSERYIALALERLEVSNSACGVVIVEVTDAPITTVVAEVSSGQWCDVHNIFVENDAGGDGKYLYLTADFPNDMRVLDISNLSAISEIGRYKHPEAGESVFVHDMTVIDHGGAIGRRVYVSYWAAGLMILDADHVTPGVIEPGSPNQPLNPAHSIDPPAFLTHDAYPTADGNVLFIEDEYWNTAGLEPVQMWDISSPAAPTYADGIALGSPLMPLVQPAHNLLVDGNRLYVGWYKGGLQAFDFSASGFTGRPIHHQVQTETADDAYEGAWNALRATIGTTQYVFQSDRRYGLIVDAVVSPPDSDDDNDLVSDADEGPCGGNALSAASRPERVDGPFAGVDDDGDTLVDETLPAGASAYDCDGDGFKGSAEDHVFSYLGQTNGDQKTCQEYDASFPNGTHKPSKRWPADLNGSTFSLNKVNIQDLASFTNPVRYLNQDVGTDPMDVRWDLVPGSTVGGDINIVDMAALTTGVSGFPPMFGGARSFNGPLCPYGP
jgi:hypothetical protein